MVLPCASVMVIMVLLNDAFTCATPDAMFLRSRRRTRVASLPILGPFATRWPDPGPKLLCTRLIPVLDRGLLLLAGNRLRRTLTGAGVGVGTLAAHRQPAPVAQSAVATKIHQPLDVHRDLAPEVTLDDVIAVDHFADLKHFRVGQLGYAALRRQP